MGYICVCVCVCVCVCITHTYTIDYYSVIKKEQSFALCSNVDQLGGYYAK